MFTLLKYVVASYGVSPRGESSKKLTKEDLDYINEKLGNENCLLQPTLTTIKEEGKFIYSLTGKSLSKKYQEILETNRLEKII